MTSRDEILRLDRAHVWHPYTNVDAWEKASPLVIARASGASLFDVDGKRYLDGNSSWWVAALGHAHPRLMKVLREAPEVLDHVAFAGMTHEPGARLAEELVAVAPPGLEHVFYTDNGSGSIEVALKVALQHWKQRGRSAKTRFVALDGAYHGDTIGPTSLGGVEVFKRPYAEILFECIRAPFPQAFEAMERLIRDDAETIAGVFVEPMVQGAAGMRMYEAAYLRSLRDVTKQHDVLLIADEVFSGYGRTGKMWACDHARITPDVMCIGKVFSSIFPMAATMVTNDVYDSFRGSSTDATLWYGHTFCGNPIGAALAREVLAIYREEQIVERVQAKAAKIKAAFDRIAKLPGVESVRTLGMIGAADLGGATDYTNDAGWRVYEEALRRGAYLRPLGNTVYVCPPLVISDAELDELLGILEMSISSRA